MISFIVFIGCIITCFGVLTTAVFYGDKAFLFIKDLDFHVAQLVRDFRNRDDIKKRRQAEQTRLAMQEYADAMFREREEHRKGMQLQEAHATIKWEKKFHGEDNLPDDIKQLEAQVRTLYFSDMFSPTLAIDAPKQPVVVHPVTELVESRDYYDPERRDYDDGSPGYYKSYYRTTDGVVYATEEARQRLRDEISYDVQREYWRRQMRKAR